MLAVPNTTCCSYLIQPVVLTWHMLAVHDTTCRSYLIQPVVLMWHTLAVHDTTFCSYLIQPVVLTWHTLAVHDTTCCSYLIQPVVLTWNTLTVHDITCCSYLIQPVSGDNLQIKWMLSCCYEKLKCFTKMINKNYFHYRLAGITKCIYKFWEFKEKHQDVWKRESEMWTDHGVYDAAINVYITARSPIWKNARSFLQNTYTQTNNDNLFTLGRQHTELTAQLLVCDTLVRHTPWAVRTPHRRDTRKWSDNYWTRTRTRTIYGTTLVELELTKWHDTDISQLQTSLQLLRIQ